jgi:hypothetical protein
MNVWEETKLRVDRGDAKFPTANENRVARVRPKARDSHDKIPMPQGDLRVRQGFWLDARYIATVLEGVQSLPIASRLTELAFCEFS